MTGEPPIEIDVRELHRRRQDGEDLAIVDVREPWEVALCAIPGSVPIPLGMLPQAADRIPETATVVVVCHHGARSMQAVLWLRRNGLANAVNLRGGIDAWARDIQPDMVRY